MWALLYCAMASCPMASSDVRRTQDVLALASKVAVIDGEMDVLRRKVLAAGRRCP
jgi:hypothetical protein